MSRLVLTIASIALLVPATAAKDQVFRKGSRKPLTVTVISEDYSVIKYKPTGVDQELELRADLVERIAYADTPQAYTNGIASLESGDYKNAVSSLQLALKSKTRGNWITRYANYQLGRAYFQWGATDPAKYTDAAKSFDELLKKDPDNRFLPQALRFRGLSLSRSGDARGAGQVFDQLASEAQSKKLGLVWEAEARILKADAFSNNNLPNDASSAYKLALDFARSNAQTQKDEAIRNELSAIAGRAQLSQGESLLKAKNYREARRFFETVASNQDSNPSVIAGAQCGLGEVLLAEGKYQAAFEKFAKVRVVHYLSRAEAARATYFMGTCCLKDEKEPGGKRKATEYFREVVNRYADTQWAEDARANLK